MRNIECGTGTGSFDLLVADNQRLQSEVCVLFLCKFVVDLYSFIQRNILKSNKKSIG